MAEEKTGDVTEKIRAYFKKWEWIVLKWGWKFDVNYRDSYDDMPEGTGEDAAAIVFAKWLYLQADIYINVKKVSSLEDKEIEYMVVHELTHLLVSPLQEDLDNAEMCVTTISRIFQMGNFKQGLDK